MTETPSGAPIPVIDEPLVTLATRQHGVVTRDQLRERGFSDSQIKTAVHQSRLIEIATCVYAVGHTGLSRRGRTNAVLLQFGTDRAAVSHASAARAWDMVSSENTGPIHISTIDRRDLAVPKNIVLHRPRSLSADEIVWRHHVPVTTPERTLRDQLADSSVVDITRMLERMVTVLNRSPDDLHEWGHALQRARGKGKLLLALDHVVGPAVLRSELETQFRSLCQRERLPLPETNVRLGRWEVDALWKDHRLVVELDSWRFHGGRWQFDRDRVKGLELADLGYEVIRLTWPQVKHDGPAVAAILARVLARRAMTR